MLGEVTAGVAAAVTSARALKILIPLSQENIHLVGVSTEPLPHLVEAAVYKKVKEVLSHVRG
jgi:hypothetical protein